MYWHIDPDISCYSTSALPVHHRWHVRHRYLASDKEPPEPVYFSLNYSCSFFVGAGVIQNVLDFMSLVEVGNVTRHDLFTDD